MDDHRTISRCSILFFISCSTYFFGSYFFSIFFLLVSFLFALLSVLGMLGCIFLGFYFAVDTDNFQGPHSQKLKEPKGFALACVGLTMTFGVCLVLCMSSSYALFGESSTACSNTTVSKIQTIHLLVNNKIYCSK